MITGLVLGIVIGFISGLALWLFGRGRTGIAEADARAAQERAASAEVLAAQAEARVQSAESRILTGEQQVAVIQEHAQGAFAELSRAALRDNNDVFQQLAAPLRETLDRYEQQLRAMELERQDAYTKLTVTVGKLDESHEQLQRETHALVAALRTPQARGRWGEVQLRRVVELAGMVEHCDFSEQVGVQSDAGRQKPDMVVHLPGGRQIIVDAKVPLDAYLRVVEAQEEASRKVALKEHARQVRDHVDEMSKRKYWEKFEGSAEFVVVFIPSDSLLSAAYEAAPDLQEKALESGVLLTTPTMLIALLRSAAFGWRQERLAKEARSVQELGAELFRRLETMGKHFATLGSRLNSAVGSYNDAMGSFEKRVLVSARKLSELGAATGELPEIPPIEPTSHKDTPSLQVE